MMHRRMGMTIVVAAAVLAAIGCATIGVSSHVDRDFDFGRVRTFDWGPADAFPVGDPRLDTNPTFLDHLHGAVERQLEARGYERVVTGRPQLLVHFHASTDRRLDVNAADARYGYCLDEQCRAGVTEYEAGTLIVDVVDARTNRLIWRGWAQDSLEGVLNDRDRLVRLVEDGVARMFAGLPVGALKAVR